MSPTVRCTAVIRLRRCRRYCRSVAAAFAARTCSDGGGCGVVPAAAAFAAFGAVAVVRSALRASLLLPLRVSPFSPFQFRCRRCLCGLRCWRCGFSRFSPPRRSPLLRRSGFRARPSLFAAFAVAGTVVAPRAAFLLPALLIGLFLPACGLRHCPASCGILSVLLPASRFAAAPLAAALGLIEAGDAVLER